MPDCTGTYKCKGLCITHYSRFRIHGDPLVVERRKPGRADLRFLSKIELTDTCWLWTGAVGHNGYGRFSLPGKTVRAHRYSFEIFVGPIPTDMEIDHVYAKGCRHKNCVNPAHLEPVTHSENARRREEAKK